jgi:hypothetical protein
MSEKSLVCSCCDKTYTYKRSRGDTKKTCGACLNKLRRGIKKTGCQVCGHKNCYNMPDWPKKICINCAEGYGFKFKFSIVEHPLRPK